MGRAETKHDRVHPKHDRVLPKARLCFSQHSGRVINPSQSTGGLSHYTVVPSIVLWPLMPFLKADSSQGRRIGFLEQKQSPRERKDEEHILEAILELGFIKSSLEIVIGVEIIIP
ncbi:unnamed protein product [Linum trigynum]|uniref:Uncharacterized protein n=1 Tax=Linum trigynum TaxID=586398 RepID=A0AAV2CCT6_9ROSI